MGERPDPQLAAGNRLPGRPPSGAAVVKNCLQCGTSFDAPPTKRDLYHFCSDTCRWNFHQAKSQLAATRGDEAPETPNTLSIAPRPPTAAALTPLGKTVGSPFSGRALSPQATAKLRGRIADSLAAHIDIADQVVRGTINWTPTQARVFATLLGKVVPDLSASHVLHEKLGDKPEAYSRERLERIAAGLDDIIEGDPAEPVP